MRTAGEFWSKVTAGSEDECWPWTGSWIPRLGYGNLRWHGKVVRAHRMAWVLSRKRRIPKGKDVLHSCDYRLCCNPKHLRLGVDSNNQQDAVIRGRHARVKLTVDQVRLIRSLVTEGGLTQSQIGLRFGVDQSVIGKIIHRKRWGYVE